VHKLPLCLQLSFAITPATQLCHCSVTFAVNSNYQYREVTATLCCRNVILTFAVFLETIIMGILCVRTKNSEYLTWENDTMRNNTSDIMTLFTWAISWEHWKWMVLMGKWCMLVTVYFCDACWQQWTDVLLHFRLFLNDLGICLPVKGICEVRVTILSYSGACVWAGTLTIWLFLQNKTKKKLQETFWTVF